MQDDIEALKILLAEEKKRSQARFATMVEYKDKYDALFLDLSETVELASQLTDALNRVLSRMRDR